MASTFEEIKEPYEILIRFADGVPKGAHAQYIERLIVNGVVRSEIIGNAEPLDIEDFPTSAIMSDTARDALAEVTRLNAEIVQVKQEAAEAADAAAREAANAISALEKNVDDLEKTLEGMTAQRDNQAARATDAENGLTEALARISGLEQDLGERQASIENLGASLTTAQTKIAELEGALATVQESQPA